MTDAIDVFHFSDDKPSFEDLGQTNGNKFWFARDLMRMLGYEDWNSFNKAINKAIGTCTTLNIPVADNFIQCERSLEGVTCADFKLSRFACCLTALNGDTKKRQVAAAQAYFVSVAEVLRRYFLNSANVERVNIREEVSEREVSLSGVAHAAGVKAYALFQNAGYRGMYNMDYRTLKMRKGIEQSRSLLDFMKKDELAAHLFRISLTEGRIKRDGIRGQYNLEKAAEQVGLKVRHTMIEETGVYPENIPIAEDIKIVKRGLKQTHKELRKLDSSKNKRLLSSGD